MDSSVEVVTPNTARKRARVPEKWKRNAAKAKRYAPSLPPVSPTCGHCTKSYRCATLKMIEIANFHKEFYATRDKQMQDAFLLRYCTSNNCKRRRPKNETNIPKVSTVKCHVRNRRNELVPVCQAGFLKILNITKHRLQFVMKNYAGTGKSPRENRGGDHTSHKYLNKKESVINFIKKFKCVEAHYTRSASCVRRYLPSDLNIKIMAKMYDRETNDKDLKVKESYFRDVFNKSFNLGFGTPRTDVCSTCLSLDEKIKHEKDSGKKNKIIIEKRVHKLRSKAFYSFLQNSDNEILTLSFDCQKNQVLPKVPDQSAYYSRQLYIYNLCFVQGSSKEKHTSDRTFMYTWTENEYNKGSCEIASAIYHRLNHTNFNGIDTLRLMCDGCGGQNKNCIIIATCMSWFMTAPKTLKTIELIYPVTGHSFLPSDRVFGRIEQVLKTKEIITSPEEYKDIFKRFGTVIEMGNDCKVSDWRSEAYSILKSTGKWHFKFNVSKRFILTKPKTNACNNVLVRGEPHYRTDVCMAKSVCKPGKNAKMIDPVLIEKGVVDLNNLKLRDVHKLLTKHYGDQWKTIDDLRFFNNLLEGREFERDENQTIEEEFIEGEGDGCAETEDLIV